MKNFVFQVSLFFFLPILFVAAVTEYSLRQIPNDYSYKNQWLEKNSRSLKILSLGSSSVLFGIDPQFFDLKAFNGAHVSQTLNYDNFIFNKFIGSMDSLKYLVLDINYLSPFSSLETNEEWWRAKNYSIYYGANFHEEEIKYNYELGIHNFRTFKMAANGLLRSIGLRNYSNINVDKLGFGTIYSSKNKRKDWNTGKEEALKHNKWLKREVHLNLINKNRIYVEDIIKKCATKNIKVLLISTPVCQSYSSNLNPSYLHLKKDFCNSFAKINFNVNYIDFSDDNRFVDVDFFDGNHLNEIGAKKLTLIINDKLYDWK